MQLFEHHYHIEIKGVALKRISHISDVHLTTWDALSSEEEILKAEERTEIWKGRVPNVPEPYVDPIESLAQYGHMLEIATQTDALVLSGDIMDYVSGGNARAMERGVENLPIPVLAVCGNHEKAELIPDGMRLSMMKQPVYSIDLGDLLLIGINNGQRVLTREQLDTLKASFDCGKPVILVMHIPYVMSSVEIGDQEYVTRRGDYARFNPEGAPEEVQELLDLICAPESPVAAVLTGHMHNGTVTKLREGLYQYGVAHGIGGHMNVYTVGEKKEN